MANAAFTCATVLVWLWHTGSHELPTAAQAASQLAPFALVIHVPHEDAVGSEVGEGVGFKVGSAVGSAVGEGVGFKVGSAVGEGDGLEVGFFELRGL